MTVQRCNKDKNTSSKSSIFEHNWSFLGKIEHFRAKEMTARSGAVFKKFLFGFDFIKIQ
ncbi:hypothetical protein ACI75Y_02995 [Capnocytophaga stomatis]|uniref:hypothetical protein n=1 Tax=Capnocytophaga stomatis TaxID=1848904 RepID=UPI003858BCA7